jgi:tetratricopeptide (TPR) repeat protein
VGRYEEALADFARAIELEPSNAKHFSDRADLLVRVGRYKEALGDYTYAIELEPENTDYIDHRARLLSHLSRYEGALIDYKRIIELKPKDDHYFGQYADMLSELERYEEAIEFYTQAIELRAKRMKRQESQPLRVGDKVQIMIEPLNYETRRANTYRLMGHYEEALADYDRAIDEDKRQKGKPLMLRARLFQKLGMHDKALADRKQAIEEFTHEIEQGDENDFLFADHLLNRYEEGLADLNKLIQLNPDSSTYFAYRAEINIKLNRPEEALADLNHTIELEPIEAINFEYRASYFIDQERYEEALNDIDQALKLKLNSEDDSNTVLINLRGLVSSDN